MEPVRTKAQMYRLLAAGAFGNTIPQFFTVEEWEASPAYLANDLWGIRSASVGADRRMRLNVPRDEVASLFREWYPAGGGNISPMIDRWAILRAEVIDTQHSPRPGLNLFYVPPGVPIDPADPWRGSFRNYGQRAAGATAVAILEHFLWPSDMEDLRVLIDEYPEHTIEFSACSRAVGTIPNRRCIVWEVRKY